MVALKNKSYKFCLEGNNAHSFLKWYIINGAIETEKTANQNTCEFRTRT
jgi:hypothetical protein